MQLQKLETFILNKQQENISVSVSYSQSNHKFVFLLHGLSGFKEQPYINLLARLYPKKGYNVVKYDATNSFGMSGGELHMARFSKHLSDFYDVVNWGSNFKEWFHEPFSIAGHSLGALAGLFYATKNPMSINNILSTSTVVSGSLYVEAYEEFLPKELNSWKKTGLRVKENIENTSNSTQVGAVSWNFVEELLQYDIRDSAELIQSPVLIVAGSQDLVTPPKHQKLLFDKLQGEHEFHIIEGVPHTFESKDHLQKVTPIINKWLDLMNEN